MKKFLFLILMLINSLCWAGESSKAKSKELACLAKNVYFESSGEPLKGKIAVAQVTVQRTQHKDFPNSICGVIYQSKKDSLGKKVCQFSWNCNPNKKFLRFDAKTYEECKQVARLVLIDGYRLQKLKNSLYFHAGREKSKWNRKHLATIGNHKFY